MQTQTTTEMVVDAEALLQNFQVEELEERLENVWDSTDPPYVPTNKIPIKW